MHANIKNPERSHIHDSAATQNAGKTKKKKKLNKTKNRAKNCEVSMIRKHTFLVEIPHFLVGISWCAAAFQKAR